MRDVFGSADGQPCWNIYHLNAGRLERRASKLETLVLGSNAGVTSAGVQVLVSALPRSELRTVAEDLF